MLSFVLRQDLLSSPSYSLPKDSQASVATALVRPPCNDGALAAVVCWAFHSTDGVFQLWEASLGVRLWFIARSRIFAELQCDRCRAGLGAGRVALAFRTPTWLCSDKLHGTGNLIRKLRSKQNAGSRVLCGACS